MFVYTHVKSFKHLKMDCTSDSLRIPSNIPKITLSARSKTTREPRTKYDLKPLDIPAIRRQLQEVDQDDLINATQKTENTENEAPKSLQSSSPKKERFAQLTFSNLPTISEDKPVPAEKPEDLNFSTLPVIDNYDILLTPANRKIPHKIQCSVKTKFKTPMKSNVSMNQSELGQITLSSVDKKRQMLFVNKVEYWVLKKLGQGGSSEVFLCYNPELGALRAIKCVSLVDRETAIGFINEVNVLKSLQKCERIIQIFDHEINPDQNLLYVVLELGSTDLHHILKQHQDRRIPYYDLTKYWAEMLLAVREIHANNIIHSDLKPANFLLIDGRLKLIDFGISSRVGGDVTSVSKGVREGSCNYISPEALRPADGGSPGRARYRISFKSDVWSLGCILYQLVYKRTPFGHIAHAYAKMEALMDPEHKIRYPKTGVHPKIVESMRKCLRYDMRARPSIDELLAEVEEFI